MKRWSSSSNSTLWLPSPILMIRKPSCLLLPVVPLIRPVKSVGTLSRASISSLSRTRLYLIKTKWCKWMALRALYFLALLMWEMRTQGMWAEVQFTRQVREVAVRGHRAPWVSITFNNSNRSSRTKTATCNRPSCNQVKQQPSWCPRLASPL
jgi:hypothetical protein